MGGSFSVVVDLIRNLNYHSNFSVILSAAKNLTSSILPPSFA